VGHYIRKLLQVVLCIIQKQRILIKTYTNTTNLNTIWGRTEGSKEGKKELYLHGSILVVTSNN
jgi:hypothetical protein